MYGLLRRAVGRRRALALSVAASVFLSAPAPVLGGGANAADEVPTLRDAVALVPHPRAAWVEIATRRGLRRVAAFLVRDDAAWTPFAVGTLGRVVQLCQSPTQVTTTLETTDEGARCAPVVTFSPCAAWVCPRPGLVFLAASPIAEVPALPEHSKPFQALGQALSGSFPFLEFRDDHNLPPPRVSWLDEYPYGLLHQETRDQWQGSLGLLAGGNAVGRAGAGLAVGGSAAFGWHYVFEHPHQNWIQAESWGAEIHGRLFHSARHAVGMVGLRLAFSWFAETHHARFRLPAALGVIAPEVGVAVDPEATPRVSGYATWSLPFGYALTRHQGLELRPSFTALYRTPEGVPIGLWQMELNWVWR